jgi:hypothetical protein
MTKEQFLSTLHHVGLNPANHDVEAIRLAYLRLGDLFVHLETEQNRAEAKALALFDPRKPL